MKEEVRIYTIGFTRKTARKFFALLRASGARRIIDVRLNNVSQLAGFAKRDDLEFFADEICHIDYIHLPELAPTRQIRDEYKRGKGDWASYERKFIALMERRAIEKTLSPDLIDGACLLCSEDKPHHCHRRLVAEYLKAKWSANVEIEHLE